MTQASPQVPPPAHAPQTQQAATLVAKAQRAVQGVTFDTTTPKKKDLKKVEACLPLLQQALQLDQSNADAHRLAGLCLMLQGQHNRAIVCWQNVIRGAPQDVEAHIRLGDCFRLLGKHIQATHAYLAIEPHMAEDKKCQFYHALATTYIAGFQLEKGYQYFQKCLEIEPENLLYLAPTIGALMNMNRLDEAMALHAKAEALYPEERELLLQKAELERRSKHLDAATKLYQNYLENPEADKKHVALSGLAKIAEKEGRYDDAFDLYTQTNEHYAAIHPDAELFRTVYAERLAITDQFLDSGEMARWTHYHKQEDSLKAPIMMLGFPRSGTTLLEQMLSAHPRIEGTREHNTFELAIAPYGVPEMQTVCQRFGTLAKEEIDKLRTRYFEHIRLLLEVNPTQKRVLEKRPMDMNNLLYHYRFFPESKYVLLLRDPRDVILSCYKQVFAMGGAMANTLTLDLLVPFYIDSMARMYRSLDQMDVKIHTLKYEDLVADPEAHLRQIIEFVGEVWSDKILRYYESESSRQVTTPSAEGVVQPVYKSAKGSWKHYEKQLEPYMEQLQPYIEKLGYET